jgi:hypothetical protein
VTATLYETDFYAWTQRTVDLLRDEEFAEVDWNNLIEEIESLGKSQRQEVRSRLTVLIMHLLKLQYQPARKSRSWRITVITQRVDLAPLLDDNPSLRAQLSTFVAAAYPDAVKKAVAETGLPKATFPVECPWTAAQIMDEEFWPTG